MCRLLTAGQLFYRHDAAEPSLVWNPACANAEVVENPRKERAGLRSSAATLGAAVIYIVSTNVIAGIAPNMDLANSTAPFGLALAADVRIPEAGR